MALEGVGGRQVVYEKTCFIYQFDKIMVNRKDVKRSQDGA